ncbi:acetate--CoA ligase family protein [Roseococcus pinisoli]|uniref:Acetate--CoA ligase family protein n=1 Tax=Roseococcus pinisoli TaxID=2835040 RepID=A0ABS5QB81_9PROT|nr:acetate--CoA ligase family protein [Roseococcus pinisoli]MBS7810951.1 acetate--CoA ligase family protein [Roseococcus pinisoli]
MDFSSLDPLISPRSFALIGASDDATRIGGRPIAYMKERGFKGAIYPVNPKRATVQGLPAYPDVASLPAVPDVAVVAVPGEAAIEAIDALGQKGCKAAIVFTAGFAEVDEAGAAAQDRLVATAKKHGMRLLGPNCLGLFNDSIGFYPTFTASFDSGWPVPGGRIGIASQSGAYGTHLFSLARDRGIGANIVVTTGNEGEVALGDVLGWMAQSPDIDVICAYAEGIRESEKFLAALRLARANRKPIVMMKVGRSELGGAAAQSHTASIAGDDAITDAVLQEFGVVRARNTEELLDIAYAATKCIYPAENTLGVMTVSGGAGVLISDAADAVGFPMPAMPQAAQDKLRSLISFCAPRNPVDCTAQAINQIEMVGEFTRSMAVDGGYSSCLIFFSQVGGSRSVAPKIRGQLKAVMEEHPDRLWALSIIAPPDMVREYEADGFLVFEDPTRAVTALHALGRFGQSFAKAEAVAGLLPKVTLPAQTPTEAEGKRLLAAAGVPAVPERGCAEVEAAVAAAKEFGFPVVLKILSPDILHKSEIGGVLLDIDSEAAVREGFATLLARAAERAPGARIEGVLVAKQIKGAVEMALGMVRDPVFGPVAMVGLGGIFIEVLKDVTFRRCPFDAAAAEEMIRSLKGFPLLDGVRGRKKADVKALAEALANLSTFAAAAGPQLVSIDINPLLVLPEGEGAYAADAVLEIGA